MEDKKDFYIGWQDTMPDSRSKTIKKFIIPTFIVVALLAVVFVYFQKPFNNHIFDFGNSTEITGTYIAEPFPMLIANSDNIPEGSSSDVLLVGYFKMGAKGIMKDIEAKNGTLNNKVITLSGTLIYGDGKTLLELTDGEESLINVSKDTPSQDLSAPPSRTQVNLSGEIIDPKCYFGVMKPAEGKIHKSCAVRCISGGIPPVFRHESESPDQPYQYYIMTDMNGNQINDQVLSLVAEKVNVSGVAIKSIGWDVIQVDVEKIELQ